MISLALRFSLSGTRRARIVAILAVLFGLTGCQEQATLPEEAVTGPSPTFANPVHATVPTINITPAKG